MHRAAARLDGRYDLVACVLSSDPERGRVRGAELGFAPDRSYGSLAEMLESERQRGDPIDAVAIMTPNDSHLPQCKAALAQALHVLCDKPLTNSLNEALELVKAVRESGAAFCLTHNYSGYPMLRQARAMVAAGDIGDVRQAVVEYSQGQLSSYVEPEAPERLRWRLDRKRGGPSAVLGDIGTHAHHLLAFVSGQPVVRLAADLGATVPGRENDDYAGLLLRLENGARGIMWLTQAASGAENLLRLKLFGSRGGLEWDHSVPNLLKHTVQFQAARLLSRGQPDLYPAAKRAMRAPLGHPEGFHEAFANLYSDAAEAIAAKIAGATPDPLALDFPTVEDGARGLRFVEAAHRVARGGRPLGRLLAHALAPDRKDDACDGPAPVGVNTFSYVYTHSALDCLRHLGGMGYRDFEILVQQPHFWATDFSPPSGGKFQRCSPAKAFASSRSTCRGWTTTS